MDERASRAIAHLAEAVYLLSCVRDQGEQATVPVTIGDTRIMVTPKTAEALADAVDSMNAYLDSESPGDDWLRAAFQDAQPALDAMLDNDEASVARRLAELKARVAGPNGESIGSGEWSAAAVAQCNPDLYADVTDLFSDLDLVQITKEILDDPQANKLAVTLALDSFFGEVADSYADEDEG